ncbi:hypothetical protein CLS_14360 [[Clostridium] cf. saccharolyticum K10]|nr:hypothetical protein CLS_14360 [[Clostridium] cf. saccharolyticum K10]
MDFPSASLHSVLPMKYKNGIGIQVRIFREIYMCLVFAPVFKFFYFLIFSSFTTHSQCVEAVFLIPQKQNSLLAEP